MKKPKITVDAESGAYTIELHDEHFLQEARDGTQTGFFLDILAHATESQEYNDLEEYNFEWFCDNEKATLDHFNFEEDYLQALNEKKLACAPMSPKDRQKMFESDLLPGAYFALNHPDDFKTGLEEYEDKLKDQSRECMGDYNTDSEALNKELAETYEAVGKELYDNWKNGDYRGNFAGILNEAREKYELDELRFIEGTKEKEPTMIIVVSKERAEEICNGEYDKVNGANVADWFITSVCYHATQYVKKERERNEKARAERERVKKYQEEQKKEREAARVARLQAMKKA